MYGKCENLNKNLLKWCNYVILLIKYIYEEKKKYDRRVLTTLYTYAPLLVQLDLELYRQMKRQKNKSTIYTKRGKIALKKKKMKNQ